MLFHSVKHNILLRYFRTEKRNFDVNILLYRNAFNPFCILYRDEKPIALQLHVRQDKEGKLRRCGVKF